MKKRVVFFLLSFVTSIPVFCTPLKLDSLKNELIQTDGNRLNILMEIAADFVDSISYYDFVTICLQEALDTAQNRMNDSIQVDIYNYWGLADFNIGAYENATRNFYKALNILNKSSNFKQEAKVYNNLGMIFDELDDYNRALEFYKESFRLDSISNNEKGNILSFINIGISYQNLKRYNLSRQYYNDAYLLAQKYQDSLSLINIVNNQGTLEYDLKNYEKSLNYYNRALKLYKNINDLEGIAISYNNIGLIHLDQKKYPLALKYFEKSLKMATELNLYDFTGDIYSNLTIYYEEVKDYERAYEYYDKYNIVYDSLIGEKQNKMIRKLEVQYKSEKKQREILELMQENLHQKEIINSSKNILVYLYIIILLVIAFLAILFYLLRKEKLLARQLHDKTRELKKLNVSKDRFFSIIAHDLKNPFNALVSYTSLLRSDFDSFTREELNQIVTDLSDATEQGVDLLENLLHWTRSQTNMIKVYKTSFHLKTIIESVINLASPNLSAKSQNVKLEIDESLYVFADKDMIATVIRNLVFNSIKFSNANTLIRIKAIQINTNVQVSVIDQGIGIDVDKQYKFFHYEENTSTSGTSGEKGSGLGLLICREFVEKNDGVIWVESEPGKGATFRFMLPFVAISKNG